MDPRETLTFGQHLERQLLNMVDLWLFGFLGILLIKHTEYNQRLGDIWAKTVVPDKADPDQDPKERPETTYIATT